MNKIISVIALTFLILPSHGKILEYKPFENKRSKHTYEQVCSKMGFNNVLLIEKVGISKIDCMNSVVHISDYCQQVKEYSSDKVIKGRVDLINKGNVICEYANAVTMKISCDESHKKFCRTHISGCLALKKNFAKDLDLLRSSIDTSLNGPVLNCKFISMKEESLADLALD